MLSASGCTGANDANNLPPDVKDPATLHTPAGAMARYRSSLLLMPALVDSTLALTGILTDELADLPTPFGTTSQFFGLDSRQDLGLLDQLYMSWHHVRGQVREARGFLETYAPDSSSALAGHLYGLEAYAEVFLADVFCSGIPLSTVDFNGDYTLRSGSSTQEVYEHAVALFDSALTLTGDSVRLQQMAAVGKGRALLALGRYAEAAAAVAGVPDAYMYQLRYTPPLNGTLGRLLELFVSSISPINYMEVAGTPSAADQEGATGLDYRSSNDPRTLAKALGPDKLGHMMYFPVKYPQSGAVTLTLADGTEARLIEAEAALQANPSDGTWLAILNRLRTEGPGIPVPTDTIADTLGVSGCDSAHICGDPGPGGDAPEWGQPAGGFPVPEGYNLAGSVALPLASGDALQLYCTNNSWYTPCYADPSNLSTTILLYVNPAHLAHLSALTDPGTAAARVALLFRERAFWLYLTGHRQGDLRRLIRQYDRLPQDVYPSIGYPGGTGSYGTQVVAPVPDAERQINTKYTGCVHLNA